MPVRLITLWLSDCGERSSMRMCIFIRSQPYSGKGLVWAGILSITIVAGGMALMAVKPQWRFIALQKEMIAI